MSGRIFKHLDTIKRLIDKIRFLFIPPQAYTPFFQNGFILPIFGIGFNVIEKKLAKNIKVVEKNSLVALTIGMKML